MKWTISISDELFFLFSLTLWHWPVSLLLSKMWFFFFLGVGKCSLFADLTHIGIVQVEEHLGQAGLACRAFQKRWSCSSGWSFNLLRCRCLTQPVCHTCHSVLRALNPIPEDSPTTSYSHQFKLILFSLT